jgi:hypothetical protein
MASGGFGGAPNPIPSAVETCDAGSEVGVSLGDNGRSLSIDTEGEDYMDTGASYSTMNCLLEALNVSDSIQSCIDSTRALDGRQSGSWDNLSASWGFHPDTGTDLAIEITD